MPGRSREINRMPGSVTTSPPNPSHRLIAAPEKNSTGTPSSGPHSAQPSLRPEGSSVRPDRSASTIPYFILAKYRRAPVTDH
ncbi:hypothetical protein GCM10010517_02360 [Streptosporangium fragile]|uniref:Uncharacterized protein n=1 Tax=Streptosporangium fragile TaxID=46186 RepID=A0ABN3VQC7_9ACTN